MNEKTRSSAGSELVTLANALRANTVKLRFFRGATYDGFADEYLQQLTQFIDGVKPLLQNALDSEMEKQMLEDFSDPNFERDLAQIKDVARSP